MDRRSNKKARMVDVVSAESAPRCTVSKVRSVLGLNSQRLRGAGMAPSTSKPSVSRQFFMVFDRFLIFFDQFSMFPRRFSWFSSSSR